MKKQKEFINVQQAMDEKAKMEKTRDFLKIPMLVSIPLSIFLNLTLHNYEMLPDGFLGEVISLIAIIAMIATGVIWVLALVKGGKMLLSFIGKILFWGFILLPLPINLVVGFLGAILVLYAILFAPWVVLLVVMFKLRKEIKLADEYIYYNSAQTANVQETVE